MAGGVGRIDPHSANDPPNEGKGHEHQPRTGKGLFGHPADNHQRNCEQTIYQAPGANGLVATAAVIQGLRTEAHTETRLQQQQEIPAAPQPSQQAANRTRLGLLFLGGLRWTGRIRDDDTKEVHLELGMTGFVGCWVG